MDALVQDIRFGWRLLRRSPGFTIAAALALALGVGATTAVFSVLDHVVLRPLPYFEPDRLAMIWEANDNQGLPHERISPVNFVDYRGLSQMFADAAAWWYPQLTLTETTGREPMRVNAVEATPEFFAVLGVQPVLGAGFPQKPAYARDGIAVISHRLWRERFASDPAIIGKTIALNGPLFTITGIMPPGFQYPGDTDVWHRITWDVSQHSRGAHFMESIVRLRPGVTVDTVNHELRALTRRLGREYPSTNADYSARAIPLATEVVGSFSPALYALFGAAVFLLVIACTNVASLLLARATVREREVAVRTAIGASRVRLIRQFFTESMLLAAVGTGLGVLVALGCVRALVAATPVELPGLAGVGLDGRMLLFVVGLALLTSTAFGVVPALLMARGDIQRPLKEAGRGGDGARRRARSMLVVAEVGLAVMLLVGAALLARSFQRLVQQDPGFRSTHAVTAKVELPYSYADFSKIVDFYDRLLTSLRAQPGVTLAGAGNFLPLEAAWRGPYFVQGRPRPRLGDEAQAQYQTIDDDYFRVLGVPLRAGRFFNATDTAEAPGAIIVNDALARREWPGGDPIGQTLISTMSVIGPMGRSLMKQPTFQVVGIVASVKNATLVRDAEPAVYFSFRQFPFRGLNLVVQGRADPAALLATLRTSVQRLDPTLPLAFSRTVDRIVSDATDRPRALMLLMGTFASLALVLSALGIYAVLSYSVNQRRQELSLRMALGARPGDVLWLVVRQGLGLALVGGAAGVVGALAVGRAMASLLYGVPSNDAAAFVAAIGLALTAALAACLLPARRAAALDPIAGLRAD